MRDSVSYLMDEIWERAVETALDGEKDRTVARTLTLDGTVKCVQGRLPPPSLLERLQNLQHLSIASIGLSSLEQFPRLWNLERLILSDNMIAGGLEFLVEVGLDSLRDLDLSNNRIQYIEDLAPLAQLKLVSLDLYECPVTRVKDYRSRVFRLIKSLKYLDKMDEQENERPESEDDDDEEENEDEEDPGSGEIDGEDKQFVTSNGDGEGVDGVVDVDAEGESEADEEEMETLSNGSNHLANGFRVEPVEEDGEDENDSGEEIDEEDRDDDVHVDCGSGVFVEVREIVDSGDDEEDGIEYEDGDDDDDDDEDDDDEDDDDDDDDDGDGDDVVEGGNIEEVEFALEEPEGRGLFMSMDGEIDGHDQGEEDVDEDDNGETGEEEEMRVEYDREFEDDDEEEDCSAGYLVQPVGHSEALNAGSGSMKGGTNDDEEEEVDDDDNDAHVLPPHFSNLKRKRDDDGDEQ